MPPRPWMAELQHVWFAKLGPADWYAVNETVDDALRRRFEREWRALRRRQPHEFLDSPRGALAAVLLFDQVPRNIFRGSALSFASDPLARAIARKVIARGWYRALTPVERQFLYMPFMHSEAILDQQLSVALFARLGRSLSYARDHHAIIARFGRFPHRNDLLGRQTTPAEAAAIEAGHAW